MVSLGSELPLRPIMGEEELVFAWLAENRILPEKNERGRYTLREREGGRAVGFGVKLLVVDNLGIATDEDLKRTRRAVLDHPRWKD